MPSNKNIEVCACDESNAYRKFIEETAGWLRDLGAGGEQLGPMNDDEGAAALLADARRLLSARKP